MVIQISLLWMNCLKQTTPPANVFPTSLVLDVTMTIPPAAGQSNQFYFIVFITKSEQK